MTKLILIRKASGELEPFSAEKLKRSLQRSGASDSHIDEIIKEIESRLFDGISSKLIYDKAFALLKKKPLVKRGGGGITVSAKPVLNPGAAARYKLKNAMMELGPTGHPFEHFVGEIFYRMGYNVEVGQVLQGNCVTHEMDVIATKEKTQILVECKFHFSQNVNASVQVPLYVRSRVDDIIKYRKNLPEYEGFSFIGCVVTNTRFTADASAYGECSGLKLLSWDYPQGEGLKELIDREKIFPLTVLTKLSTPEKQRLMEQGIVVVRQIHENNSLLNQLSLDSNKRKRVLEEIEDLSAKNG